MSRKKATPEAKAAALVASLTAPHPVVGDGGAGAPPLSPGHLMGIPMAPETQAEHAARLGDRAGTYADAGHLTGTSAAGGVGTPPVPGGGGAPTISTLVPVSVEMGSGDAVVELTGTGFVLGLTGTVNGAPAGVAFVSATQASIDVDTATLVPPSAEISITTPAGTANAPLGVTAP